MSKGCFPSSFDHWQHVYMTWLRVTQRVSYMKQELFTLRGHLGSSLVLLMWSVLLIATQTTSTEQGRISNTEHINRTREEPSEQHRPHQQNKGGLVTQNTSTEQGRVDVFCVTNPPLFCWCGMCCSLGSSLVLLMCSVLLILPCSVDVVCVAHWLSPLFCWCRTRED
jgi:hypothetical protein